ncbi:MAG TPA: hypothetical protein VF608_10230, partial [Thermoanaerobaculia bacterium]
MSADRLRNLVNRLLGRKEPAPDVAPLQIALMEDEDGHVALRRILPYLFWPSEETSREALSVVAAVIASASAEELPEMEETVRVAWRYARREPEFVDELSGTHDSAVMAVLSFHPSGYVRERVVRQLAKLHDGSEVRYLLLRLNDWVPQVREVARNAVNARLRGDSVTAFTRNFALVARIIAAERVDVSGVLDRVARVLGTDAGRAAMRNTIESSTLRTARAFARFVIERVPDGLPVIVRAGAESRDLVIRAWVAASAMRAVPHEEALPLLQRLSADSSPAVRRVSLIALAEHFSHEARSHLL